ncbi:MAG: hypothetical protein HYS08_00880 [Chlamydiae bacterium]|nr:hypothetical protein [Chlamydiota bacterium]MBI3265656.1 hypothetical protein [Chlamydiota bacterium]
MKDLLLFQSRISFLQGISLPKNSLSSLKFLPLFLITGLNYLKLFKTKQFATSLRLSRASKIIPFLEERIFFLNPDFAIDARTETQELEPDWPEENGGILVNSTSRLSEGQDGQDLASNSAAYCKFWVEHSSCRA